MQQGSEPQHPVSLANHHHHHHQAMHGKRKKTLSSSSVSSNTTTTTIKQPSEMDHEEDEEEYRIPHKELDIFMKDNQDLCNSLFMVFERALDYVHQSLDLYIKDITVQPILQPGEDFWYSNHEQGSPDKESLGTVASSSSASHKKHKKNTDKK